MLWAACIVLCACMMMYQAQAVSLQKYIFSETEQIRWGARCLDGSGSGFYYAKATQPAAKDKWLFSMSGGGYCLPNITGYVNVQSCFSRAKTDLGSSKTWPSNQSSSDPAPYFAGWNRITIPYCGGDLHAGRRNHSISGLYYAGHLTVAASIAKAKEFLGLSSAVEVAVTGGSAGGVGVFNNIDYFQRQLPSARTFGVSEAGWFIEIDTFRADFMGIRDIGPRMFNLTGGYSNEKCAVALGPKNQYKCGLAEYVFPFIDAPLLIIQSVFDSQQLQSENGAGTNFTNPLANSYRVKFGETLKHTLAQVFNSTKDGLYATATYAHVISNNDRTNGVTKAEVLNGWLNKLTTIPRFVMTNCSTPNCAVLPTSAPNF